VQITKCLLLNQVEHMLCFKELRLLEDISKMLGQI
jgi:hypothetical protein